MASAMNVFDGLAGAGLTAPLLLDEAEMIYSKFIPTIKAIEKAFTGWNGGAYPTLVGAEYHLGVSYYITNERDSSAEVFLKPDGQVQYVDNPISFPEVSKVTVRSCSINIYDDPVLTIGLNPSVLREQVIGMLRHHSCGLNPMREIFNERQTGEKAENKENLIEFIRLFTATKINKSVSREEANTVYKSQTLYRDFGFTNLDKLYIVVCLGLKLMRDHPRDGLRTQIIGNFEQFCKRYAVQPSMITTWADLRLLIEKLGGTLPTK